MVKDIFLFSGADGRVYGYMHQTCLCDAHVHDIPFRTVLGDGSHAIAFS